MTTYRYRFKTILALAFLLCIVKNGHSISRDSLRNYYEYKYEAELAIMDADYRHAVKTYKNAYQYKTPNSSDLYNSFKTAYLCNDSAMAKAWYELEILHGWNRNKFETNLWGETIKNDGLYQWINTNYDSLHQVAQRSNMPVVAKVMDSILAADQKPRDFNKITEQVMQQILHVDSMNVAFLKNYMEQNGYPGFDEVGIFEEFNIPSTIWFVMLHTRYTSKALNKPCLQAVLEGKLPPGEYASIIDLQGEKPIYYQASKWAGKQIGPVRLLPKDKVAINKLRAELFLEPLDEYRLKLVFQKDQSHPFFEFVPFMILSSN